MRNAGQAADINLNKYPCHVPLDHPETVETCFQIPLAEDDQAALSLSHVV